MMNEGKAFSVQILHGNAEREGETRH